MTASPTRIVIRHLSGSKTNQIEQFDLGGLTEITIGRDPGSKVVYDLARDDAVSRKHAVIRVKNDGKEVYFRIADLNSSNGTLLNGERIGGEVEVLPDDVVELGPGGPKFVFDLQPRPSYLPARTRSTGAISPIDAAATRLVAATEADSAATAEIAARSDTAVQTAVTEPEALGRVPVGRQTILRMLTEERSKSRQIWIAALAALILLAVIGGSALYMHGQNVASQLKNQLVEQERLTAQNREAAQGLADRMGLKADEINKFRESTVFVRVQWQLYDKSTNRPIFQRMANVDGEWLPCYVRVEDGKIVRWLTLDNNRDSNYQQVGGSGSGSGFVIRKEGFILTNKVVAAGWSSQYEDFSSNSGARGAVYSLDNKNGRSPSKQRIDIEQLSDWVPENGGWLFESTRPSTISPEQHDFFGRNETLTVQFPGTRIGINATLLRTALEADLAEIKIDVDSPVEKTLDLADDDTSVHVGDRVVLLGYSGVSNKTRAVQETNEGGRVRVQDVYIPEPTVTEGVVSLLPAKKDKQANADVRTYGTVGETYQLDIYAGPGSAGGPVLNTNGKVIAVDSLRSSSAQHVAFAVPVSFVHELLRTQR